MTPHEKAVAALNRRLERLQANLREAKSEAAQRFLVQSVIVTLGMSEAMTAYLKAVGEHAQRRHGSFKQGSASLGERHADLLKSGQVLLEQFKASPTDRAIKAELERAQRDMAAIQKELRRGAYALQRELTLTVTTIDELAESVRRLCEAEQADVLPRLLRRIVGHARELYGAIESAPAGKNIVDAAGWETLAVAALEQASDFYDAYARAGYQATLAIDLMTLALSETPPQTAEEMMQRGSDAIVSRLKEITARFTAA